MKLLRASLWRFFRALLFFHQTMLVWLSYHELCLVAGRWCFSLDFVYIQIMAPQIAGLSETLITDFALIRPLIRVLAEVISQVAALAEDGHTARELAAEVLLWALAVVAEDLDYIVPFWRYAFEILDWTQIWGLGILLNHGWLLLCPIFNILHRRLPWRAHCQSILHLVCLRLGLGLLKTLERHQLG